MLKRLLNFILIFSFSLNTYAFRAFDEYELYGDLFQFSEKNLEDMLLGLQGLLINEQLSPAKIDNLQIKDIMLLMGLDQNTEYDSSMLAPALLALKEKIEFWNDKIGFESLQSFVENTEYGNPFHILLTHKGAENYLEFLFKIGIFTGYEGDSRSLNAFLQHHLNADGLTNNFTMTEEDWNKWVSFFIEKGLGTEEVADFASAEVLRAENNLELLQRLPQNFSKASYEVFNKHRLLIGGEFLAYNFSFLQGQHHLGSQVKLVDEALTFLSDQGFDQEFAKSIALDFVIRMVDVRISEGEFPNVKDRLLQEVIESRTLMPSSCIGLLR